MTQLSSVYFASHRSPEDEALRLQKLDAFYAAPTRAWLQQCAGLTPGMAIAEFGPGSGRMLDWFAGQTGLHGDVLGVDIDLSRAGPVSPPVRLMQADLMAPAAEPGGFDLVYARMVLGHLSDPKTAIARLMEWLKPGGRLALADLDCSTSKPVDMDAPGMVEFAEALDATRRAMDETGLMDSGFGARLAGLMQNAGLAHVQEQRFERVVEGGSDWTLFQADNVEIIARLTGAHGASEVTARYMRTPGVHYHDQVLVFCTGIKPA
ncbi:class I SAM-dependent methyltransferase [Alkalicaulis satelles]|nr:class I SAM-dependent methyltransferase [Alkalicaulis satelles]